ncbi:uncharacterized protein BXZ73DRAFT_73310 [Epithele typhae]|uniref:uncharacterized protein n=1 Tax=Epithele typhae TaxID=378194 RepID=UPI0020080F3E|nr:uncharacterized protein BXZ73DRAFT_73310 [Epithele typhae]KAH9945106.1 hypothetical protein BXZ73DRAFT_73310 [Epithele typhae]
MLSPRTKAMGLLVVSLFNLLYIWRHVSNLVSTPNVSHCSYPTLAACIAPLSHMTATAWIRGDFPQFLPLPNEPKVFVPFEDTVHYLPIGNDSEMAWRSASSAGYGYVRLGPEDRVFVTSMFHELHCLRMLNRAYSPSRGVPLGHIGHCLNYIRQEVLCAPDLALEPPDLEERDFSVERTNGVHACKNWDPIYHLMDSNYHDWKARTGYGW